MITVGIDARSLQDPFTSNYTYWAELLAAMAPLAESSGVRIKLFGDVAGRPAAVPEGVEYVPVSAPNGRWWSLVAFPRAVRRHGCDAAHMQYTVSPLFRVPTLTTIHDVSYFIEPRWFSRKDAFFLRKSVPAACRRAAVVIAVSHTCAQEIETYVGVSAAKILPTPNGVPAFARFRETEPARQAVARELNLTSPYALLVGGIQPRKNWPLAIQAIAEVRRQTGQAVDLVVTGKVRDDASALAQTIRAVGGEEWVRLLGGVPEAVLPDLYAASTCLLHPTYHEGFGLTVLEAFACGTPVVASNRGAVPEVAGEAAVLLPVEDRAPWPIAVAEMMDEEVRTDYIRRGRVRAQAFDWRDTARLTLEGYRRAARR